MTSISSGFLADAREKQDAVQTVARDVFKREWSTRSVRDLIDDPAGYSPALWQTIRELGWSAIAIPEEFGGEGGSFVELYGLAEESGRALAATPLLPTLAAAHALVLSQNRPLQERMLPRIARGEVTLSLALLERGLSTDPADPAHLSTVAGESSDNGGYQLDGVKLFVPFGQHADYLVTIARLPGEEGLGLFLVDAASPGLSTRSLKALDWSPLAEVTFAGVNVPADQVIARGAGASDILSSVLVRGVLMTAIELLGVAEGALDLAVGYAGDRVAFGRPIGSFQAVKHKLVDLRSNVEVARALSQAAAQQLTLGSADAPVAVARAVFWAQDTLRKVPEGALQVFGGIGFTWEHDIHFYLRRAATLASLLGERATQREIIVKHLDTARA